MKNDKCKICGQNKSLVESHVIPEFCYSELYNENHKMTGITGRYPKPTQKVQKGLKEYLLCDCCENERNRDIEQPYQRDWQRINIASRRFVPGSSVNMTFDFEIFRKFHLSILYLASVAKRGHWSEVSLGSRHEDIIRRYIKGEISLPSWMYPVYGIIMVQEKGIVENRLVLTPSKTKMFGSICYGLTFCGIRWGYFVASHPNHEILKLSIKPNGDLSMCAELWSEFKSVQDLGSSMKNKKIKTLDELE